MIKIIKSKEERIGCSDFIGREGRANQPIVQDDQGTFRFKSNAIVRTLLDAGVLDMNKLAVMQFTDADREQFAQLIGYSVSGIGDLSYSSEKAVAAADEVVEQFQKTQNKTRSTKG